VGEYFCAKTYEMLKNFSNFVFVFKVSSLWLSRRLEACYLLKLG
jgi:hypothetical protein